MPEAIPATGEPTAQPSSTSCYKCQAALQPEAPEVCPACGRRQTRQCFCGTTIGRGLAVCPTCGTDWSRIRRKSRSSREPISKREFATNALLGGLIALASAGLLHYLASGGIQSLAASASSVMSNAWPKVARVASQGAAPAAVFLLGCIAGIGRFYINLKKQRRLRGKRRSRERPKGR
jgi:hypothetical protein